MNAVDDNANIKEQSKQSGGLTITDGAGNTVFDAKPVGFSSDRWTINVTTCTKDINVMAVGSP
jgi:hypothetical protein